MEKLKFRAYVKSLNKVFDVQEIDFKYNAIQLDKTDWKWYNIADCVLLQSINEVDKNGVEIFEGDILQGSWDTKFQIVYCNIEKSFKSKTLNNGDYKHFDYFGKMNECEIIGNAYTGEI